MKRSQTDKIVDKERTKRLREGDERMKWWCMSKIAVEKWITLHATATTTIGQWREWMDFYNVFPTVQCSICNSMMVQVEMAPLEMLTLDSVVTKVCKSCTDTFYDWVPGPHF